MLIVIGALLVGSWASFSSTTVSTGNGFAAGTVTLTDDDGASSLFSVAGLRPGDSAQKCITAQYGGSLGGAVRVYLANATGALAPYLQVTLDEGAGGSGASCTGFVPDVTSLSSASLSSAAATFTSYATGTGSWGVTGSGQTRRYRFTVTLVPSAPNGTQGSSASVDLRWEARDSTDLTAERARAAVLADGPVSYYRLGDAGTTAVDLVGAANGTYQGSAFTHPAGITGSPSDAAASFNGSNQYVSLPTSSADLSAGFTVESWARFTGASGGFFERIVELGSGEATNNVTFGRLAGGAALSLRIVHGTSTQSVDVANVIDARWHHFVGTQTAGGLTRVYVDGVEVGSGTIWVPDPGPRTSSAVGKSGWNTDALFAGTIDDVAVYTRALTAGEVSTHFRAGR